MSDFETRFERLLQSVMDGRAVPFVGAGFSDTARITGNSDFTPKVGRMVDRLKQAIEDELRSSHYDEPSRALIQALRKNSHLGQLAEIGHWLFDGGEILERLDIHRFSQLQPTRAHRYLAYLVRERLVSEVITTNFDTCIEQALRRSFGWDGQEWPKPGDRETWNTAVAIRCADECRHHGARLSTEGPGRYPVLRLYKINGCADDFRRHGPFPILLTERQLQDFGNRAWARDLLRERTRSRALVFIGFGSDEPQIRHTVLALMEEFQREGAAIPRNDPLALPNAPFVVAYESTLSFPQIQILAGFVDAHVGERKAAAERLRLYLGNTLTGRDFARFPLYPKSETSGLKADNFMQGLFQAVFGRLLHRYTAPGSVFYQWLGQYTPYPAQWQSCLMDLLYPTGQIFGRRSELFSPVSEVEKNAKGEDEEKELPGPCLLWRWLRAIHTESATPDETRDYYHALADDPLGIPIVLMILAALTESQGLLRVRATDGFGLCLEIADESRPARIFLRHSKRPLPALRPGTASRPPGWRYGRDGQPGWQREKPAEGTPGADFASESRLFRVIDIPFLTALDEEGRVRREHPAEKPTRLRIERYRRIAVGDLFHWAVTPERLPAALRLAFAEAPLACRGLNLRALPNPGEPSS